MSGGRFNYADSNLKSEIFGWEDSPTNVFEDREISELVWDVLDLIHDYDWYASGDTGKETYLKSKTKFKKKWLDNRDVRVKRIVDEAIQRTKDELYETFTLEEGLPMKILKPGKVEMRKFVCPRCGCIFAVSRGENVIRQGSRYPDSVLDNTTVL